MENITLKNIKKNFEESYLEQQGVLSKYRTHFRYFHGDQLPFDVKAELSARNQPEFVENIYQKLGNKILGFKISSMQEIKVIGRQEEDREVANLLTDLLKAITDKQEYKLEKKACDIDLLLGLGIFEVNVKTLEEKDVMGKPLKEIYIKHLPASSVIIDIFSQKRDASDAKYFHKTIGMDYEDFLHHFGDKKLHLETKEIYGRTRVYFIETWYKKYDKEKKGYFWHRARWQEDTLIEDVCDPLEINTHPFAIRKLYSINGQWYGIFRSIYPMQNAINFAQNRIANMLGSLKLLVESSAVDNLEDFSREWSRDNAVVMVNDGSNAGGKIREFRNESQINYLAQLVNDYRRQADLALGLNDEALGQAVQRLSGSAIEMRQNAGLVGLQQYLDASSEIDKALFSKAILMIKQHFNAEMVFNIADRYNATKYFTINAYKRNEYGSVVYENGKPAQNDSLKIGHYDITLITIPKSQNAMAERYANSVQLMEILKGTYPEIIPDFLPMMLKDAGSTIADELSEKIIELQKLKNSPQAQKQAQAQQQQLQQAQSVQLAEVQSETDLNIAKAKKLLAEIQAINNQQPTQDKKQGESK